MKNKTKANDWKQKFFLFRQWNKKTYLTMGIIFLVLSLLLVVINFSLLVGMFKESVSYGNSAVFNSATRQVEMTGPKKLDIRWEFLFPPLGLISLLLMSAMFILFGTGKFKINKFSNSSLKLTTFTSFILVVLPFFTFISMKNDNIPYGFGLLVYLVLNFGSIIALIALILLVISLFKQK